MASNAHPPEKRAEVINLIRAGSTRNDIARQTGVAAGLVTRWAKDEGLSFDRTATQAATAARVVDLKLMRTEAAIRAMQIVELDQVEEIEIRNGERKFRTVLKAGMGAEEVRHLDFIPTVDKRNLALTTSNHINTALSLDKVDRGDGSEDDRLMLIKIAAALGPPR